VKRSTKIGLVVAFTLVGLIVTARFLGIGSGAESAGGGLLNFNVGKTESRNNSSSSSTSSSTTSSGFNARHVFFFNESAHPLSQRISALVVQGLKESPQVERIDLKKSSQVLSEGMESPDLFVRINLVDLKESGLFSSTIKATVTASISDAPWKSSLYSRSSVSPPLVEFNWNSTVENETIFSGVRSDHYGDVAQSIANELTKGISNQISQLSEKFSPLPELPRVFFGPYEPVADFDFLKAFKAHRDYSYSGLLTHNETFWRFQSGSEPRALLQTAINRMEALNWKLLTASLTNTEDFQVRFQQAGAELQIFRLREDRAMFSPGETKVSPMEFVVHYRKPFSQKELEAALGKLFAGNPSIETLLPFRDSFSAEQREKFYALLEKTPTASPHAYLQMAESYLNRKQTNAALNLLLRTKAMTATLINYSTLESDIDAMATRISPKQKLEVTPETYREIGFLEITNGQQTLEMELDSGQPILLFTAGQRGAKTFSLTIRPAQKGVHAWAELQTEPGMRSTTSSSFPVPASGSWRQTFRLEKFSLKVEVFIPNDGKRMRCTVQTEG
jgi:hypothetical protein